MFPIPMIMTKPKVKLILKVKGQALRRSKNRAVANAMLAMFAEILVITLYKVSFPCVDTICVEFAF